MRYRLFHYFALVLGIAITSSAYPGSLTFTAEIPKPPAKLPLLKLTAQTAPVDLINKLLGSTSETAKVAPLGDAEFLRKNQIKIPEGLLGIVEDEHVRVLINRQTGDAAIYPTLSKLDSLPQRNSETMVARAREILESRDFIAPDDTKFVVDKPQFLYGATLVRRDDGKTEMEKPAAPYLAYFLARRFVGDFQVDGAGSRALLAFAGDGSIQGLTRVWKYAGIEKMIRPWRTSKRVSSDIARQLRKTVKTSDVVVDHIELAYYDGNRDYLQPVYRFTARIRHNHANAEARTDDDFVIGYVPVANAFEPLPSINQRKGPSPKNPKKSRAPIRQAAAPSSVLDPIVGRYVVRNDDAGWVNDANDFWNSLSSTWTASLFSNSQYYWAEPRLFTSEKDFFINAMNLALIEVHGDWWLYSTLQNCCDLVNINGDIPTPGYGPSANGQLADWIIHSCEVVPGPDDTGNWPDPWWTIFGGVRNVVGYRTIMYISDGAGGPYGTSLGNLAPVVSAWLNDVISLNAYSGHPTTPAHGGIDRPMGRPSTISMCGHDGDSVLSTSSLGRANCLTVWWFPD